MQAHSYPHVAAFWGARCYCRLLCWLPHGRFRVCVGGVLPCACISGMLDANVNCYAGCHTTAVVFASEALRSEAPIRSRLAAASTSCGLRGAARPSWTRGWPPRTTRLATAPSHGSRTASRSSSVPGRPPCGEALMLRHPGPTTLRLFTLGSRHVERQPRPLQ